MTSPPENNTKHFNLIQENLLQGNDINCFSPPSGALETNNTLSVCDLIHDDSFINLLMKKRKSSSTDISNGKEESPKNT